MIPDVVWSQEVIYFLKVNGAFVLFYAFYRLFFYKDTFFKLRRALLLAFFALAFLYPLMNLQEWVKEQPPMAGMIRLYSAILLPEITVEAARPAIDWLLLLERGAACVYLGGVGWLAVRFFLQLGSILRLAHISKKTCLQGVPVYILAKPAGPFSFFRMIFLYPAPYSEDEISEMLAHEKTHVAEGHSIDVMLSELASILCWVNPFVWLLKREVRYNLEYLADNTVIRSGYDSKSYQYHLLGLAHHAPAAANLYNSFHVLPLKNRIHMMNKKRSRGIGRTKYLAFIPLVALLMLLSNIEAVARIPLALSNPLAVSQQIEVKAKVVDESGEPLIATAIVVSNSSVGTVADENGCFTLKVPADVVLRFSYPGKAQREIAAKNIAENMKIVLASASGSRAGKVEPVVASAEDPSDPIYQVVDQMPQFPGGDFALLEYVAKNVKYPQDAHKAGVQGRVICEFVVAKDGRVTDAKIFHGVHPSLDAEALRVIRSFPVWTPGSVDGEPVRVRFTVPIIFRLQ